MGRKVSLTMGRCPEPGCRGEYALRQDGMVRKHSTSGRWGKKSECPGSERQPSHVWERIPGDPR